MFMTLLNRRLALITFLAFALLLPVLAPAADPLQFWGQWRGPLANGSSPTADPPLSWSETEHVKWKTAVPGAGTSTPIIWENRVFLLTAISTDRKADAAPAEPATPTAASSEKKGPNPNAAPSGEIFQFDVLCYDRATGKLLWQKTARETAPHEGHHPDHGFASGSPVTDGGCLIAYFGSRGVHCYDLDGRPQWSKDFGPLKTRNSFGEGSSAALHGNTVVLYRDDETDNDFIVALDKRTGNELWRTPRNEPTGWSTPVVAVVGGKPQVVVNATGAVRSYDLATGKELWNCTGQTANAIPTPALGTDTIYVTSGFRGSALFAIALGRSGNLDGTDAIRWKADKNTPYVPSPLLADQYLYVVAGNNGVLSCFDAQSGAPQYQGERLEGLAGIYASPVSARDRLYVLGRDGTCLVLKTGPRLEILAKNKLNDKTDSSIALAGPDLFIRGHQNLYCIGEK